MARVPTFQEQQRLSIQSPVQAVSPSAARLTGESQANLGKAVQQAGKVAGQLEQNYVLQLQKESADKVLDDIRASDDELHRKASREAKFDNNGTSNMLDLYKTRSDDNFNKLLEQAPDNFREDIKSSFRKYRNQKEGLLKTYEQKLGWEKVKLLAQENDNAKVAKIQESPQLAAMLHKTFMLEDAKRIQGNPFNEVQKQELNDYYANAHAKAALDGYMQKAQIDVSYAHAGLATLKRAAKENMPSEELVSFSASEAVSKGFITQEEGDKLGGKPYMVDVNQVSDVKPDASDTSKLMQHITGPQRDQYIDGFQRLIKAKERENLVNLSSETNDFFTYSYSGGKEAPSLGSDLIKKWMNTTGIKPDAKARKTMEIAVAVHVGQEMIKNHNTNPNTWDVANLNKSFDASLEEMSKINPEVKKLAANPAFMSVLKKKVSGALLSERNTAIKERNADVFTYSLKHNENLQNLYKQVGTNPQYQAQFDKALLEHEKVLGVSPGNYRLIGKPESLLLSQKIKAIKSPEIANAFISEQIEKKYGNNAGIVLADLIEDDKTLAPLGGLFQMSDAHSRSIVISNSVNAKEDAENFKTQFAKTKPEMDQFKAAVFKATTPYAAAARDASVVGNSAMENTFREQVSQQAKSLMIRPGGEHLSFEKAAKMATSQLLDSNYGVAVHHNGAGLLYSRVTRSGESVNGKIMQGFLDNFSDQNKLDKIVGKIGGRFLDDLKLAGVPEGDLHKISDGYSSTKRYHKGVPYPQAGETIRDRWVSELAHNGVWRPAKIPGNIVLTYKGAIVRGKPILVNGKEVHPPLELSYDEIKRNQDVLDHTRDFGQDFKEFFKGKGSN